MPAPWGLTVDYERESVSVPAAGRAAGVHALFVPAVGAVDHRAALVPGAARERRRCRAADGDPLPVDPGARARPRARRAGTERAHHGDRDPLPRRPRRARMGPWSWHRIAADRVCRACDQSRAGRRCSMPLFWLVADQVSPDAAPFRHPEVLSRTLYLAALLNLGLGLVNLLPAFPLDGGVILQDTLSLRLGHPQGHAGRGPVRRRAGLRQRARRDRVVLRRHPAPASALVCVELGRRQGELAGARGFARRAQPLTSVVNSKEYRRKRP